MIKYMMASSDPEKKLLRTTSIIFNLSQLKSSTPSFNDGTNIHKSHLESILITPPGEIDPNSILKARISKNIVTRQEYFQSLEKNNLNPTS
jgi:hypothetical protein